MMWKYNWYVQSTILQVHRVEIQENVEPPPDNVASSRHLLLTDIWGAQPTAEKKSETHNNKI